MDVEAFLRDTPFAFCFWFTTFCITTNLVLLSGWAPFFFFFSLSFFWVSVTWMEIQSPFYGSSGGRFMVRFNWRGGVCVG